MALPLAAAGSPAAGSLPIRASAERTNSPTARRAGIVYTWRAIWQRQLRDYRPARRLNRGNSALWRLRIAVDRMLERKLCRIGYDPFAAPTSASPRSDSRVELSPLSAITCQSKHGIIEPAELR